MLDVYINFTVSSTVAVECLHVSQYMNSGTHSLMGPRLTLKDAAFKPVKRKTRSLQHRQLTIKIPRFTTHNNKSQLQDKIYNYRCLFNNFCCSVKTIHYVHVRCLNQYHIAFTFTVSRTVHASKPLVIIYAVGQLTGGVLFTQLVLQAALAPRRRMAGK